MKSNIATQELPVVNGCDIPIYCFFCRWSAVDIPIAWLQYITISWPCLRADIWQTSPELPLWNFYTSVTLQHRNIDNVPSQVLFDSSSEMDLGQNSHIFIYKFGLSVEYSLWIWIWYVQIWPASIYDYTYMMHLSRWYPNHIKDVTK